MSRQDDLKKLIAEHHRHLQILKEQEARYGSLNVPTHIVAQIQDRETAIETLQAELSTREAPEEASHPKMAASPAVVVPVTPPVTPASQKTRSTPRIFLCHASQDKLAVRDLYNRLCVDGFNPWLDEEKLLPGQNWRREITKAVREADIVIVCLSRNSITGNGYIRDELAYALDIADKQPEDTIFIIPVRLEECEVPERLRHWQWVNLFEAKGYERLLQSLQLRAQTLRKNAALKGTISKVARDPIWQMIGVLVAIIGVAWSVFYTFFPSGSILTTLTPTPKPLATIATATGIAIVYVNTPESTLPPSTPPLIPTATPISTPIPTNTPLPTNTPVPPTNTPTLTPQIITEATVAQETRLAELSSTQTAEVRALQTSQAQGTSTADAIATQEKQDTATAEAIAQLTQTAQAQQIADTAVAATKTAQAPTPTFTPTQTPTSTPTSRPVPTPTFTPTQTPTSTPTSRPTSTPTFAPTQIPTLTPTSQPMPTPLVTIDPNLTVYDDFNNSAYDGNFNPELWAKPGLPQYEAVDLREYAGQATQENGVMTFVQQGKSTQYTRLISQKLFRLDITNSFEVKLMLNNDIDDGNVHLSIKANLPHSVREAWSAECNIRPGVFKCFDAPFRFYEGRSYSTPDKDIGTSSNSWYTVRIDVDPKTMSFSYFLNDQLVGVPHIPVDASDLRNAEFQLRIGIYEATPRSQNGKPVIGYVDGVWIRSVTQ